MDRRNIQNGFPAPSYYLPEETYEQLLCSTCNNYLSVPPVSIHVKGYVCGRHEVTDTAYLIRAQMYEKISRNVKFPCKYKKEGCVFFDWFDEIKNHEKSCSFGPILCPALSCEELVAPIQMFDHVENFHKDLIIEIVYKIPLKTEQKNYFLFHLNNIFVLHTDYSSEKNYIALSYMKEIGNFTSKTFAVVSKVNNNYNTTKNIYQFVEYANRIIPNTEMIEINSETLKSALKTNDVQYFVQFSAETNNAFLKQLECPICFIPMAPPIFLCTNRHSICKRCSKKTRNCPTCRAKRSTIRNYSLEEVSTSVQNACENYGCLFAGALSDWKEHSDTCEKQIIRCILKKCNWIGVITAYIIHMTGFHPGIIFFQNQSYESINLKSNKCVTRFMIYDEKVFKIHVSNNFVFSLNLMGVTNNKLYTYVYNLNFFDPNLQEVVLSITHPCLKGPFMVSDEKEPHTPNTRCENCNEIISSSLKLQKDLLPPDNVYYQICIKKMLV